MKHLGKITGLFVGRIKDRWPGKPPSAIAKHAVAGPLELKMAGFDEDSQADLAVQVERKRPCTTMRLSIMISGS